MGSAGHPCQHNVKFWPPQEIWSKLFLFQPLPFPYIPQRLEQLKMFSTGIRWSEFLCLSSIPLEARAHIYGCKQT